MKILIIGSKGFIGTHCVQYFSQKAEVWGCDVAVDYTDKQYFLVDATNADYTEVFENNNFDACINCSGAANVPDSLVHPQRDFTLNTVNVFKLLDAIRKYSPNCKFINLSSAAVYGNPETLPVKENQSRKPVSPYGLHKKYAEEICSEYHEHYGLRTCSLRIFSAYGEGLKKQIYWDLSQKMKNSSSIELFGTGNETRDFIHVSDIINILDLIIQKAKYRGEAINVGNGTELKISTIVDIFAKKSNWNGKVTYLGNNRKGDPTNWVANIDIIKELGYNQSVSIETGIERYTTWLKENA